MAFVNPCFVSDFGDVLRPVSKSKCPNKFSNASLPILYDKLKLLAFHLKKNCCNV